MVVVDASVLVDAVVGEREPSGRLAAEQLVAPHLIDAEVGSALRRMTLSGRLEERRAARSLDRFQQIEILRFPHDLLLLRAWQLRADVSFYDALYVALAEALDIPLVTTDRALAGIPGTIARVEVIPAA